MRTVLILLMTYFGLLTLTCSEVDAIKYRIKIYDYHTNMLSNAEKQLRKKDAQIIELKESLKDHEKLVKIYKRRAGITTGKKVGYTAGGAGLGFLIRSLFARLASD